MTKCVIAVLSGEAFHSCLLKFPDITHMIRQEAKVRFRALSKAMETGGLKLSDEHYQKMEMLSKVNSLFN